jgi:hypothetical protein
MSGTPPPPPPTTKAPGGSALEKHVSDRAVHAHSLSVSSIPADGGSSRALTRAESATSAWDRGSEGERVVLLALVCQAVFVGLQLGIFGMALSVAHVSSTCMDVSVDKMRTMVLVCSVLGAAMLGGVMFVSRSIGYRRRLQGLAEERVLWGLFGATFIACAVANAYLSLLSSLIIVIYVVASDVFMSAYRSQRRIRFVAVLGGAIILLNYTLLLMFGSSCSAVPPAEMISYSFSTVLMARLLRVTYLQYRLKRHAYFGGFNVEFERYLRGEMRLVEVVEA